MIKREPAWRVFAQEYRESSLHVASDEEHSPLYVITPLGARVNRVFIVGTLIDVTNYGTEDEPSVRATLADQTGHFYLTTGQYNPEVGFALLRAETPSFLAVIGKAHVYQPEDGVLKKYIRPESVIQVDRETRDRWLVETSKATWERMEAMREAMEMAEPSEKMLRDIGIYPRLAQGVIQAVKHYGEANLNAYAEMLGDVLRYVISQKDLESMLEGDGESLTEQVRQLILSVENNGDILWADLLSAADKEGLDEEKVKDEIDRLLIEGKIFERQIGVRLKIEKDDEFWS